MQTHLRPAAIVSEVFSNKSFPLARIVSRCTLTSVVVASASSLQFGNAAITSQIASDDSAPRAKPKRNAVQLVALR